MHWAQWEDWNVVRKAQEKNISKSLTKVKVEKKPPNHLILKYTWTENRDIINPFIVLQNKENETHKPAD